jgi:hypothetical protein
VIGEREKKQRNLKWRLPTVRKQGRTSEDSTTDLHRGQSTWKRGKAYITY